MAALAQSIRRSAIGLGLFAVITGGTIAVTQAFTEQRIQEQAARAEAKALFEIIPESAHDNDLLKDTVQLPDSDRLATEGPLTVWVARRSGQPTGMIIPVIAPDGYSGSIRLLVGVDMQGKILGVRVTSHKETPGLGDRIETKKSDWILSFVGRSLGNPPNREWNVKKNGGEFDQFTGATITPRAVVKAVHKALIYFRKNRQAIRERLNEAPQPRDKALSPESIAGESTSSEHS
ncbi:electron transport complex subunit RsxG [Marinobacter sediminum]|uniref:electron transport complex subunit RsxG n=1 Tax=Marinobacter sediminum TaxID=256323 RepID=UPI00202E72B1|nr:electron transport complex subunit RsxG [Marinobacter sediminum]MCM0612489.1 electron transport complex subunit RsxG [Marinobacter sediminum]